MSHTLLQAWAKTLRLRGDERAVVQASDGATVTFRQLHARVDAWLQFHAPEPDALRGRAVVFATPNGIGWLEIFLGLLKGGAVVVPLDAAEPPLAQQRLAALLRAGFWWDGAQLVPLAKAKRYRDPSLCR